MPNITKPKPQNNSNFAKDLALIGWLSVLLVVGILAAQGKASRIVIGLNLNLMSFFNLQNPKPSKSDLPSQILQSYLSRTYAQDDQQLIPPVQIVLDRAQLGLTWRNAKKIDDSNEGLEEPTKEDYESYFAAVINRLESIANYSSIDSTKPLKINNDFVPPIFRESKFQEQEINLPPEVATWVRQKQLAVLKRNQQLSLL